MIVYVNTGLFAPNREKNQTFKYLFATRESTFYKSLPGYPYVSWQDANSKTDASQLMLPEKYTFEKGARVLFHDFYLQLADGSRYYEGATELPSPGKSYSEQTKIWIKDPQEKDFTAISPEFEKEPSYDLYLNQIDNSLLELVKAYILLSMSCYKVIVGLEQITPIMSIWGNTLRDSMDKNRDRLIKVFPQDVIKNLLKLVQTLHFYNKDFETEFFSNSITTLERDMPFEAQSYAPYMDVFYNPVANHIPKHSWTGNRDSVSLPIVDLYIDIAKIDIAAFDRWFMGFVGGTSQLLKDSQAISNTINSLSPVIIPNKPANTKGDSEGSSNDTNDGEADGNDPIQSEETTTSSTAKKLISFGTIISIINLLR